MLCEVSVGLVVNAGYSSSCNACLKGKMSVDKSSRQLKKQFCPSQEPKDRA